MTKQQQELIYKYVGMELTKARERKNMTTSQVARLADEQFGTIKAIEEGRPFYFHQTSWMKSVLDLNLNILISDACNANSIPFNLKDESNGKEEKSNKEISIKSSSFDSLI